MRLYLTVFIIVFVIIGMKQFVAASPSRAPFEHAIFSNNGMYCGLVLIDKVKVFKVTEENASVAIDYTINGWFPQAFVSDNGKRFVAIESIILAEHTKDQAVLRSWLNGKLTKVIYIDEILGGLNSRQTSDGGLTWGEALGLKGDNIFLIRRFDGSTFEIKL